MDKSELLKLAERVEALNGPDFDVNKSILAALGYTWRGMAYWSADNTHVWPGRTEFTDSLDAAITLVERPAWVRIDEWPDEYNATSASVQPIRDPQVESHCAKAATPALALCAAALRALAKEDS